MINRVFSRVYEGRLFTIQAQQLVHLFCNSQGLNPSLEMPITMLMLSDSGQERLREYEGFLMRLNWVIANLAARVITTADAVSRFQEEIEKLSYCRQKVDTSDEFLDTYFNGCQSQNMY